MALTSVLTLVPPPGVDSSISSARTVSAPLSASASGSCCSAISRPSPRRQVSTPSSASAVWSGAHSPFTIRSASPFIDATDPLCASNTTTPTGQVSTTASRSARARRSARCVRALAIAAPAWDAKRTSSSSSPSVNAASSSLPIR